MLDLWRRRPAEMTLGLTLPVCALGLILREAPIEVLGLLLFGLILTAVNSPKRKDPQ